MSILKSLSNIPGWRTKRKIVVIESDDWGSLRAPSGDGLKKMQDLGLPLGNKEGIRFNKYDDLASSDDLASLFEVLESVKDSKGHSAVLTPLCLVANPDFQKIEKNHFKKYYYHTFLESLELQNKSNAWKLWQEGYQNKLFIPEFHGREHLNVAAWMRDLQKNDNATMQGFKHKFWGFRQKEGAISYQAAFDLQFQSDLAVQQDILKDGLVLFEKLHGRKAKFFVPPNGPFHHTLEKVAALAGIEYMSTPKIHHEPLGNGKTKKHFRYIGKKNIHQQLYLTRNAFFEPSSIRKTDWVDACLHEIKTAFKFSKPATISSHRVNYIGEHDATNRTNSLMQLSKLLKQIKTNWPDVEFMSSSELGYVITNNR